MSQKAALSLYGLSICSCWLARIEIQFGLISIMFIEQIDGLVQERRNFIANTLELGLSYTEPWNC